MSESFFSDAARQWQALMQQSAGPWSEFLRAGAQSPDAFEQWTSAFRSSAGTPAETIERFVQGARDYVSFMQSTLNAAGTNPEGMSAWMEPLKRAFASPGMAGAMFDHPFARLWPAQAQGANPFASAMPFNMPSQPANLQELKSWLSLPTFGLTREHQERQQNAALAWVEYQEQVARHNEQMLKATRRGFELFEGKLAEREQPGRQIESLRALYDLWVDAAEEGYAEVALSQEYRDAYGALVNAQMRMRAQMQQEIERLSGDLGMPTRGEIDSIGQRLQALRREVRNLRGGDALIDEIAELRNELDALVRNTVREVLAETVDAPRAEAPRAAAPRKRATPHRAPAVEPRAKRPTTRKESASRRAAAAVAPSGFATRIAQFADASLGGKRKARKSDAAPAKAKHGKKKH